MARGVERCRNESDEDELDEVSIGVEVILSRLTSRRLSSSSSREGRLASSRPDTDAERSKPKGKASSARAGGKSSLDVLKIDSDGDEG